MSGTAPADWHTGTVITPETSAFAPLAAFPTMLLTDLLGLLLVIVGPVFWRSVIGVSEGDGSETHDAGYDVSNLNKRVRVGNSFSFAVTREAENGTVRTYERHRVASSQPNALILKART